MDWRTGKPNATGSAFRGISSRGRGRGRGKTVPPPSGRGGHASTPTESVSPISVPSIAQTSTPASTSSALNLPPRPKSTSRRGSNHARRAPSLSHLDLPKSGATSADHQSNNTSPQVTRRASHNPISGPETTTTQRQIPPVKLDLSSPVTPSSPRPRPSRKRSQNRTRSSSKVSTQDRISATASIASLRDREKETPPHLAIVSAPPEVQSFDLRTNIDTLVERVRAMAMAGSAVDKDRDREGHSTHNDGHIDWAGDEDDTLPDLDDWVRPKSVEPKQVAQVTEDKTSAKPVLSPVEEYKLSLPSTEQRSATKEKSVPSDDVTAADRTRRAEDPKQAKRLKSTNEINPLKEESTTNKTKSRGKHSRKKSSASDPLVAEPIAPASLAKSSAIDPTAPTLPESTSLSPPRIRAPLVHPLPPKPQLVPPPSRGPRSRALPPHVPMAASFPAQLESRLSESNCQDPSPSTTSSSEEKPILAPPAELVGLNTTREDSGASSQQTKMRAFNLEIDWAKAPRPSGTPESGRVTESRDDVNIPSASLGDQGRAREMASDPTTDWVNAPRARQRPSPTRRSPTRKTPSPKRGRPFSPPSHPHIVPRSHDRNLYPRSGSASSLFPDNEILQPVHTRSQMNSPESSPRRWLNREGSTHLRSHSSPQTGPGTRTHASRPVITLDAISRISRTLGVSGATTPPRSQAAVGIAFGE